MYFFLDYFYSLRYQPNFEHELQSALKLRWLFQPNFYNWSQEQVVLPKKFWPFSLLDRVTSFLTFNIPLALCVIWNLVSLVLDSTFLNSTPPVSSSQMQPTARCNKPGRVYFLPKVAILQLYLHWAPYKLDSRYLKTCN